MIRSSVLAMSILVSANSSAAAQPAGPQPPIMRTDLQRHDLAMKGWETVQARIDFEPGGAAPLHKHPGEEVIYVLEGTLEYTIAGKPPATLGAGGVLFVPAGTAHSARNVGTGKGSELATYIVEKGKPLIVLVK